MDFLCEDLLEPFRVKMYTTNIQYIYNTQIYNIYTIYLLVKIEEKCQKNYQNFRRLF